LAVVDWIAFIVRGTFFEGDNFMRLIAKKVRGMQDVVTEQSVKWQFVENTLKNKAELYGYKAIRTPVLECTSLFERSAGDTSDVVDKEMYTFFDKGGRSLTLRPEGTAGVLRAVLESGLYNDIAPLKLMYICSCYRYGKPQAGRYREFHQFGLEIFGAPGATADAEIICCANAIIREFGIDNVILEINSVGCEVCRGEYNKKVREYFGGIKDKLCETCRDRLERNPMRIFDCKSDGCKKMCENAPVILDYICGDCVRDFEELKKILNVAEIKYCINTGIVRGLDYYTKTVFEFVVKNGSDCFAICGGGRYDKLAEDLGGTRLPGVGLGIGLERLISVMENCNFDFPAVRNCDVYVVSLGESAKYRAVEVSERLRSCGIVAEFNIMNRKNIKSQMRYADKINAKHCIIVGDDEMAENTLKVKKMADGTESSVLFDSDFEKIFL
jgi:histidyl-tRNA synthetase